MNKKNGGAFVFWFTGLSGAGKTTITDCVAKELTNRGQKVKVFDGDVVRRQFHRHLGFCPEDIRENNRVIAEYCRKEMLEADYIFVPIISPFADSRQAAREVIGETFRLVYVKTSLKEVKRRDTKGLYQKALAGQIQNFIGIDPNVPYEPPLNADLVLIRKKRPLNIQPLSFWNISTSCRKKQHLSRV